MDLTHFSHEHVLMFIDYKSRASKEARCSGTNDAPADEKKSYAGAEEEDEKEEEEDKTRCFGCGEQIEGPSYRCKYSCKFYLHKACAELELALEINHPLHCSHPLNFLAKSPYHGPYGCNFCRGLYFGYVYHCAVCNFDLDVKCALLQSSVNFHKLEHPFHEHPLIFNENYNKKEDAYCVGCRTELSSGPIYVCVDSGCFGFNLHKECAELPLEINHPYHRKHPLTLLSNPPDHPKRCSCSLCWKWEGFVYYCSVCEFGLTLEEVLSSNLTIPTSHQHQWTLLSRSMPFTCDFCGAFGHCNPYLCTTCNLVVHKCCRSLPHTIRITRHDHPISHVYYCQQNKVGSKECRICYDEVNGEYGSYCCSASDCNYIAHVRCATDDKIWDGAAVSEDEDGAPQESTILITAVINGISQGEVVIATEIQHEYHEHNLILTFSGEVKEGNICDGCSRAILSTPFYSCRQCIFFLHKDCAELPRQKRSPLHKHLLTLLNDCSRGDDFSLCSVCYQYHNGFIYSCRERGCWFNIDIQCSLLSDTLKHPSHDNDHLLFLDHNSDYQHCSACSKTRNVLYKCTKRCEFAVCFRCITLPHTTWYKYDKHPLTLTFHNKSDPSQLYCDLCEEERDPNDCCFYYCEDCDNTLHPRCVLGDSPFIKPGSTVRLDEHSFTAVSKIWNCPPCKACGKLCNGQVFECKNCNLVIHWECLLDVSKTCP